MKYEKIEKDGFRIHIIKTNKFKTVTVCINFKQKVKKEDITIRRVLSQTLLESSNKYSSRRLLERETEDLYALSISESDYLSGNYDVMEFSTTFLNEKYTEPNMNNRSLEFLLQIICNPDIINNKFNEESLEISKRIINDNIKSIKENPNGYSIIKLKEKMAPRKPISYINSGYIKDLKKINPENLYLYYKKMINDDILDISIIGDIDSKEYIKLIDNYFSFRKKNEKSESHFLPQLKVPKKEKIVIEKLPINQSKLAIGCVFERLTDFELRYVLSIYSFILGGSGDSLLFKNIREENSLCYSVNSTYNIVNGLFVITAGINASDLEKTVNLTKENLEKMKKGDFDESEIKKAKTIFKNSCISITDSPKNILNTYLSHEYINSDLLGDRLNKIEQVTKDMVVSLANKIHIHTIYLLEGDCDER